MKHKDRAHADAGRLSDRYKSRARDGLRPVVAMDIDGVLRLRRRKTADPYPLGAFIAEVTVQREAYPHVFHSPPDWDEDGISTGFHMFSGVGAAWMRSLLGRGVEVVWATTWQQHANDYFAPILGIAPLPVAVRGEAEQEWGPAEWKSVQLAEGYPGRPILWVDDMPPMWEAYQLDALRKPNDRAIARLQWIRDPSVGTPADVDEMDEWLTLASTTAGQSELRRRRLLERARHRDAYDAEHYGSRARGRRLRRIRGILFDAIGDSSFAAPERIALYLLDHDEPDVAEIREIARDRLEDEDVHAILDAALQLGRAAIRPARRARTAE